MLDLDQEAHKGRVGDDHASLTTKDEGEVEDGVV